MAPFSLGGRKWDGAPKSSLLGKRKLTVLFLSPAPAYWVKVSCCCTAKSSSYTDDAQCRCQCVHQCQCHGHLSTAKSSGAVTWRCQSHAPKLRKLNSNSNRFQRPPVVLLSSSYPTQGKRAGVSNVLTITCQCLLWDVFISGISRYSAYENIMCGFWYSKNFG